MFIAAIAAAVIVTVAFAAWTAVRFRHAPGGVLIAR